MAKKVWRGDAPDVPQIDVVEFAGDPVVAEGSDLIFAINDKQIVVEAASAIADVMPEVAGDTGGVSTLLAAAAAAINGSEIPEFAELEAAVEIPDPSLEAPFHRLTLTSREPGRPFTVDVDAPHPTIDIDVLQVGGPGLNERQRFWFAPTPSGGTYTVSWNLGSGLETSAVVPFNATADGLKAAMIAGMPSLTTDDILVSGAGSTGDPFVLELTGALAETSVVSLLVDVSQLTGNGVVSIATMTQGGTIVPGGSTQVEDTFTDSDSTNLTSHTSDSSDTWAILGTGAGDATIQGNSLSVSNVNRLYRIVGALPADGSIAADFTLPGGTTPLAAGFFMRSDSDPDGGVTIWFARSAGQSNYLIHMSSGVVGNGGGWHAPGTYRLTVTFNGNQWRVQSDQADFTFTSSFNLTETIHGLNFAVPSGVTVTVDNLVVTGAVLSDEKWQISTNGSGGTFTLTKPGGSTTSDLSSGATAAAIKSAIEGIYGGTWTVTGSGTSGDPWVATAGGALAGTNQAQPTGDGTNLTGGFDATVHSLQDGSPPLPQKWSVALHSATGGTWMLEFLGRLTSGLAHNANAAAVEAALVAIDPGDFTGLFDVTGAGSFADPFMIEVAGRLAGEPQALVAHNEELTGTGQALSQYTRQQATGRNWWTNAANWRDFDTGEPGIPDEDDDVWIQTGDDSNSILYGLLQSAVKLNSLVKSSLFSGQIGLPLRTQTGYVEYRPRHLAIGFAADGDKTLLIGNDRGQGSGRINLDTGDDEVHIRVERTDGPLEPGFQALNWRGNHAANTLTLIEGFIGVAAFAFETAQLAQIVQRGGVLQLGPGTAVASGGLDKTSGDLYSDGATIGGVPLIIRG